MSGRLIIILSYLFFSVVIAVGQDNNYSLSIHVTDNNSLSFSDNNISLSDSTGIYKFITSFSDDLIDNGYLTTSVDSIIIEKKIISAYLTSGLHYKWLNISFQNIPQGDLRNLKIDTSLFSDKAISISELSSLKEKIIAFYEDNSFPFAVVYLDSFILKDNKIEATLFLDDLVRVTVDSIHIKGDVIIDPHYLYNYIGVSQGDGYNENRIQDIDRLINEISFLNEIRPAEVEFYDGSADIYLYINKKKANRFTGILGVLPNNEVSGELLLTGELDIYLVNSFGKGEGFGIKWQKLEASSQNLYIDADYPFLYKSPLGVEYHFSLIKKDSTYLNVRNNFGLRYNLEGSSYIKGYFERRNSSIITANSQEQFSLSGFSTNIGGVGVFLRKMDNIINPRSGYFLTADFGFGIKKMNSAPPDGEIETNKNHYEVNTYSGFYLPVKGNFILHVSNRNIWLGDEKLYENELRVLGGLNSLRGFDEGSIPVSLFSSATIEFRYLYERYSNFFVFVDAAYYERHSYSGFVKDSPIGFGVGTSFETKAGVFSVSYGLGKQFDNPIQFSNAKIHFGFNNRF